MKTSYIDPYQIEYDENDFPELSQGRVMEIAKSIVEQAALGKPLEVIGLPVTKCNSGNYKLEAGLHRLLAYRHLNKKAPCFVYEKVLPTF